MPTVLRIDGYRFYFYSHEPNEPPHVHVDRGGQSAKFWLHDATLARNFGFTRPRVDAAPSPRQISFSRVAGVVA
ncbi:MAG TPA: DUF4160 domain-containing protein [Stellaceae bacterium]|nr:DUF4160 domain-containing protein [Stellaceae bacterium]